MRVKEAEESVDLSGSPKTRLYRMEKPLLLQQGLQHSCISDRLPDDDYHPVCMEGLMFLLGITSKDTLTALADSKGIAADERSHCSNPRPSPKEASVCQWLDGCTATGLVMPNKEYTIVPFASIAQFHSCYVEEGEAALRCPWAETARRVYNWDTEVAFEGEESHGGAIDSENDEEIDSENDEEEDQRPQGGASDSEGDEEEDHVAVWEALTAAEAKEDGQEDEEHKEDGQEDEEPSKRRWKKSKLRYGNKLLGPCKAFPVAKELAGFSTFVKVWRKHYKQKLKLRKWIPFAKCSTCAELREKSRSRDPGEAQKYAKMLKEHRREMRAERMKYWKRRYKAATQPDDYMSVCIDGADAQEYYLPYVHEKTKLTSEMEKAAIHLMGALCHGRDTYLFTLPDHVAAGQNVTIQTLYEVLVDQLKKHGRLPRVLYLQLDNTTRQCKGKYVQGFLELLVKEGVFEKAYLSFLPVGHTHADIDQFFSRIAVFLRKNNALSRLALERAAKASYHKYGKCAIVRHWENLANISEWFDHVKVKPVPCVTKYRHFRTFMGANGKVWTQCREFMRDVRGDNWAGGDGTTHNELLPDGVDLLADAKRGKIPDAQKRNTHPPPGANHGSKQYNEWVARQARMQEWRDKRQTALERFAEVMPSFCGPHQADCERILALEESKEPLRFPWLISDLQRLLRKVAAVPENSPVGEEAPEVVGEPVSNADMMASKEPSHRDKAWEKWMRTGPMVGDYWLFKPGDDAAFWIGRVKKNLTQDKASWVQFYSMPADATDPYTSTWIADQRTGLSYSNYTKLEWDQGWQVPIKMTQGKRDQCRLSTVAGNIQKAKEWAQRFAGGEDMEDNCDD